MTDHTPATPDAEAPGTLTTEILRKLYRSREWEPGFDTPATPNSYEDESGWGKSGCTVSATPDAGPLLNDWRPHQHGGTTRHLTFKPSHDAEALVGEFDSALEDELDRQFPKGECRERGNALVLNAAARTLHRLYVARHGEAVRRNEQERVWKAALLSVAEIDAAIGLVNEAALDDLAACPPPELPTKENK